MGVSNAETVHVHGAVTLAPLLSIEPQHIVGPLVQIARLQREPRAGGGVYLDDASLHSPDAQALAQLGFHRSQPLSVLILFGPYLWKRNSIASILRLVREHRVQTPVTSAVNSKLTQANVRWYLGYLIGKPIFP